MWNEEATILRTVEAAREVGDDLVTRGELGRYDILLIDDGSTDATGKLADELALSNHDVHVVHHNENRGLGGAVRTGFAEGRGDLLHYSDADMPFDLADVGKAIRLMRVYDAHIVSAYRFDRTGEGARRALYSYVYNLLARTLFRLPIRDVNFAFKLVRREVVDDIELKSQGSFIDVELLAKACRRGFAIIQFGVDFFPRGRGTSTLSSTKVIVQILREMAELMPSIYRVPRRPIR